MARNHRTHCYQIRYKKPLAVGVLNCILSRGVGALIGLCQQCIHVESRDTGPATVRTGLPAFSNTVGYLCYGRDRATDD